MAGVLVLAGAVGVLAAAVVGLAIWQRRTLREMRHLRDELRAQKWTVTAFSRLLSADDQLDQLNVGHSGERRRIVRRFFSDAPPMVF